MKNRFSDYFRGGGLIFSLALAAYGLFLTLKNDTQLISFQIRWLWLTFLFIILAFTALGLVIINLYKLYKKADVTRPLYIEFCRPDGNVIFFRTLYSKLLRIDHVVSVVSEVNERTKIIGIGIVANITDDLTYNEVIDNKEPDAWLRLLQNDKRMLNKTYVVPTVYKGYLDEEKHNRPSDKRNSSN